MDIQGISSGCLKCGKVLTDEEKKMGLPLCQNCVSSLTDILMGKIRKSDEKRIEQEVDNFTRFILSSGKLFKLDNITVIQCCFNIFMRETTELEDKNVAISQKIFKDAIKFMERELENINDKIDDIENRHTSPDNDHIVSMIDDIIQKGMKSGNGNDSIENIEKCIDKGMGKGADKENNKNKEDKENNKNKEDKENNKKGHRKKKDSEPSSSNKRIKIN